jgi:hypothetical protein
MTINELFETLDFSSYDKIVVHWPMMIGDGRDDEFHAISFDYAEPLQELFGDIHIMTMAETSEADGGDASLFINIENGNIVIHIYLERKDIVK